MADLESFARWYVGQYYEAYDSDRNQLAQFYQEGSMMTFEGAPIEGVGFIVAKLVSLPFAKVTHEILTMDAQPNNYGGVLVVVTGALLVEEEKRKINYMQSFQLMPKPLDNKAFFVQNDVFRLVYPAGDA